MATKKTAGKASGGKSIAKWDEELAKQALLAQGMEESTLSGGNFIGTRGGVLTFQGAEVPGNKMNVVVLGHVLHNMFYEGKFDSKNPASPVCYSFGEKEGNLVPHEKSESIQNPECDGCPMNEYGSADTGAGKACKNSRRLMVIPEGALEDLDDANPALIHVPVTSTKAWAGYVVQIATQFRRPPLGVITEVSLVPDPKNQFAMKFKLVEKIDDAAQIEGLIALMTKHKKDLTNPYPQNSAREDRPAARGGSAGSGRKAGREVTRVPGKGAAGRPVVKKAAAKKAVGARR